MACTRGVGARGSAPQVALPREWLEQPPTTCPARGRHICIGPKANGRATPAVVGLCHTGDPRQHQGTGAKDATQSSGSARKRNHSVERRHHVWKWPMNESLLPSLHPSGSSPHPGVYVDLTELVRLKFRAWGFSLLPRYEVRSRDRVSVTSPGVCRHSQKRVSITPPGCWLGEQKAMPQSWVVTRQHRGLCLIC